MEGVERVADLDVLGFCAQGIVGVDVSTRTFTVWCRVAVSLRTARVGSLPDARFSFR